VSNRKLLLADDSVTIQKVVNLTFADEGIDVVTVSDGDSAVEKMLEIAPDIILADVHMPGLNGYQICEIVRGNPETKDLPVVLLVGSFEPFDEEEAARVGANSYMTKPFQSIRQLVSQVTDLLDASSPSAKMERIDDSPNTGVADLNDINALYERSVGEPETPESETGPPRYVDAGMDDEMIEATHGDDASEHDLPDAADEPGFSESHPMDPSRQELAERITDAFQSFASDDRNAGAAATAAAVSQPEAEFDQFSATEQFPTVDQNEFALDDIELLELPPIDSAKTLEFTTTQRSMAQGDSKQVVSVSSELMDIIVQRVVEKLSEKD